MKNQSEIAVRELRRMARRLKGYANSSGRAGNYGIDPWLRGVVFGYEEAARFCRDRARALAAPRKRKRKR